MIPFLFMMFLTLLLGLIIDDNRHKGFYIIIIFSLLAFFASFRSPFVGVDTIQYFRAYKIIGLLDWNKSYYVRYEYGFFALCKLLNYISHDPQFLIIVTSIFIISSVGLFIYRYSPNIVLSSYLFVAFASYSMYMNVMRQAIAVAIILMGFPLIINKKYLSFSLVVIIATLFHYTAFICFVIIIVCQIKYTDRIFITYIMLLVLSFFITRQIFQIGAIIFPRYSSYLGGQFDFENYYGTLIVVAMYTLLFIAGLYFYWIKGDKSICTRNYSTGLINFDLMAHLSSLIIVTAVIGMQMNVLLRLREYFLPVSWIWLPAIFSLYLSKNEKRFLYYIIVFIAGTYFIIVNTYRPQWHGVVPYSFFWNDCLK